MRTTPKNLLLPYLENQLDTAQQENIAALLTSDMELADEAKRLRRITDSLRQTAARVSPESTTDHWPALRARLILAPTQRRASVWVWAAPGLAFAAALSAAFVFVWVPMHRAHRVQPSIARQSLAPIPAASISKVTPKKVAVAPKLRMPARYTYLAPAQSLPYAQASPIALPPARTAFRHWHWWRPRVWHKLSALPAVPVLAAAKPHTAHPPSAVPHVIIPAQNNAPPPTVPASPPAPILSPPIPVPAKPTAPGSPGA